MGTQSQCSVLHARCCSRMQTANCLANLCRGAQVSKRPAPAPSWCSWLTYAAARALPNAGMDGRPAEGVMQCSLATSAASFRIATLACCTRSRQPTAERTYAGVLESPAPAPPLVQLADLMRQHERYQTQEWTAAQMKVSCIAAECLVLPPSKETTHTAPTPAASDTYLWQ
jgi:hypothetical protein